MVAPAGSAWQSAVDGIDSRAQCSTWNEAEDGRDLAERAKTDRRLRRGSSASRHSSEMANFEAISSVPVPRVWSRLPGRPGGCTVSLSRLRRWVVGRRGDHQHQLLVLRHRDRAVDSMSVAVSGDSLARSAGAASSSAGPHRRRSSAGGSAGAVVGDFERCIVGAVPCSSGSGLRQSIGFPRRVDRCQPRAADGAVWSGDRGRVLIRAQKHSWMARRSTWNIRM